MIRKIKLSYPCHEGIQGRYVYGPIILIFALNRGEWLTLCPGHFGLGKNPYTHSIGCWVGSIFGEEKSLAASEFKT